MEDLLIHNLFFWFYHRRDSVVVFLCGRVQCVSEYSSHSRNSARLLRPDGGYLGVFWHEVRGLVAKRALNPRQKYSYKRGRSFEYRVKQFLIDQGYFVVRSAKSSFPDLVAIRKSNVIIVECKTNGRLSLAEKIRFMEINEITDAACMLAFKNKGK